MSSEVTEAASSGAEILHVSIAGSSGLAHNVELIEFEEIQEKLDKWTISKVAPKQIYKIETFDFKLKQ